MLLESALHIEWKRCNSCFHFTQGIVILHRLQKLPGLVGLVWALSNFRVGLSPKLSCRQAVNKAAFLVPEELTLWGYKVFTPQ